MLYVGYQGTHGRLDGYPGGQDPLSRARANYRIQGVQDFMRAVDYLETRPDVDIQRLAIYGTSRGGAELSLLAALDDRYKAGISAIGGLRDYKVRPEIDTLNFAPRVTIPVLMLNGRYDMALKIDTSSRPMYELLGTLEEHKKMVIYDGDHHVARKDLVAEILPWLDRYLGPVELAKN